MSEKEILLKFRQRLAAMLDELDSEIALLETPITGTSISRLELNIRTENILRANEVHFIEALVQLDPHDILKFQNAGNKTLREIQDALANQGYELAGLDVRNFLFFRACAEKLRDEGIFSAKRLTQMTIHDVLRIPGIGKVYAGDIRNSLAERGLSLKK